MTRAAPRSTLFPYTTLFRSTGSYDPDLNLTYWGTAQSKPWMRISRGSGNGATLYANSTLALNADTGKMAWFSARVRSEEHTSELQSLRHLVCRLLLEKKKKK